MTTLAVYLLLGSNMGDRVENLEEATRLLKSHFKTLFVKSKIYETAAWGNEKQPNFLNVVLKFDSRKNAQKIIEIILGIETKMGRVRSEKWGERLIDIDILYFGQKIISTDKLQIPHTHLHQRRFTLVPLVDLAPDFIHPQLLKTNKQLLDECTDQLPVWLFEHL